VNLTGVMVGSDNAKGLAEFYTKILGSPQWSDEENDWYGYTVGNGSIAIGPHSEVSGKNQSPGRIMLSFETEDVKGEFDRIAALGAQVVAEPYVPGGAPDMWLATFADPDGNYFQLSNPWTG
jgi:predicted enzyme related to lactoylglutathione lyase